MGHTLQRTGFSNYTGLQSIQYIVHFSRPLHIGQIVSLRKRSVSPCSLFRWQLLSNLPSKWRLSCSKPEGLYRDTYRGPRYNVTKEQSAFILKKVLISSAISFQNGSIKEQTKIHVSGLPLIYHTASSIRSLFDFHRKTYYIPPAEFSPGPWVGSFNPICPEIIPVVFRYLLFFK